MYPELCRLSVKIDDSIQDRSPLLDGEVGSVVHLEVHRISPAVRRGLDTKTKKL
jgi:hypothetical protein